MLITIQRKQILAALCTAGKGDVRYYINGVCVDATTQETRLTSTDGVVVAMQRAPAKGGNQVDGVVRINVPREALENIKAHKSLTTIALCNDSGDWFVIDGAMRTGFVPVVGNFPNMLRVMPAKPSRVLAQFDPEQLIKFAKAARVLGISGKGPAMVSITHNGNDTALVSLGCDEEYIAAVMPMNKKKGWVSPASPPIWISIPLNQVTEGVAA